LAKTVGVLIVVIRFQHDAEIDGLILCATAGMGFSAPGSTGYPYSVVLRAHGGLLANLRVTPLHGVSSPLGHCACTAILSPASKLPRRDLRILSNYRSKH
jgi:RsiW-degrading membrane proteinase PrsW (M82 family)